GPPLSGSCFCGNSFNPRLFVIVGLRCRSIGFVAARRAHAFVLVVYFCRGFQECLEPLCPEKGSGPPERIYFEHLFRYVNPSLSRYLLFYKGHGEYSFQIIRTNRLLRGWMERRFGGIRHIRSTVRG